jgi:chromosomal replication initiator protein
MNMHATELVTHYRDVRKRLFGVPTTKARFIPQMVARKPEPAPEPIVLAPLPLWAVVDLYFDWHVKVWHEAIERQVADLAHENVALRAALHVQKADLYEMEYIPRRLTKHIIAEVLENFPGVTWEDLKGKHRTSNIVYPRQLCMYEIHRQRKDLSYPAIGRLFGGRDHTTVLHAVRKIESMTSDDKQAAEWMQRKHVTRRRKMAPSPYAVARLAEIHSIID